MLSLCLGHRFSFPISWEQRKLGDIATITGGGTPSTNISEYWNGDIDWYSPVEIGENRYVSRSTRKITKLGLEKSSAKILPVGTVLFTSRAGIGNTAILQAEGCTNQGFQSITPNSKELDTYFLYTMTPKLKRYGEVTGAGSTFVEVSGKQMEQMNLMIPSLEEQKHVSQLFELMDDTITLHQRKLKHLNFKKKALLQKLFPKNGERHPELRFPEFTDAWEQRKLGDFYTFKNGLNKEKVYFGYGDSIVNFTDVFHNRQIYSSTLKGKVCVNKKELENYKVKEGDLFFTRTSETIEEIGFPAVVMEPMERVVFSGFVLRGRAEKYDPLVNIFKSYIFFTDNFRSEMKKKSSMTTRALTSGTALKEMYFSYPRDLEEQNKIGEILLRLDKIITLHQ